jgi:hypothetical protein
MTTRRRPEDTVTDPNVKRLIQRSRYCGSLEAAADRQEDNGDEIEAAELRRKAERDWKEATR